MKCFGLLLVLLLPAFGWWCETSDRQGCRGQSRHFVREAAVANPFLVFQDIKTSVYEEPIVVDWDDDGDLDVILRKRKGLSLFEFKSGRRFVEIEPNPFHGISAGVCRPAVVDWDGDGVLDLIVGAEALARWWQRHRMVLGATDHGKGIYIWWCLFVNNQFRLLEDGQTQDTSDFIHVFGQQVEGIGKMLMCLDQMRGSQYTSRIWCIFEVFVACQRSIPTTVILPELEVGAIETLEDLTQQCQVDAEKAKASVQADADAIKERIQKEHQSFEYVNQTVEQALWCEVIKFLKQSQQEPEEIELSAETPQDLDLSTSSAPVSAMLSADSQCGLQ